MLHNCYFQDWQKHQKEKEHIPEKMHITMF